MDPRQQQIEAWMEIKIQAEYQIKKLQEQQPGGMSIPADHFTTIQQSLLKRETRIKRQVKQKS